LNIAKFQIKINLKIIPKYQLIYRLILAMKYLAAYTILALSGKSDITVADMEKVLGEAQIKVDAGQITRLLASVKGKSIHQLIADGTRQLGNS
jgi:hypothetical protein